MTTFQRHFQICHFKLMLTNDDLDVIDCLQGSKNVDFTFFMWSPEVNLWQKLFSTTGCGSAAVLLCSGFTSSSGLAGDICKCWVFASLACLARFMRLVRPKVSISHQNRLLVCSCKDVYHCHVSFFLKLPRYMKKMNEWFYIKWSFLTFKVNLSSFLVQISSKVLWILYP